MKYFKFGYVPENFNFREYSQTLCHVISENLIFVNSREFCALQIRSSS